MKDKVNAMKLIRMAYKSLIISGSVMLSNDFANINIPFGRGNQLNPFGKIARASSATAAGYLGGKYIADKSWDVIESAIDEYNNGKGANYREI